MLRSSKKNFILFDGFRKISLLSTAFLVLFAIGFTTLIIVFINYIRYAKIHNISIIINANDNKQENMNENGVNKNQRYIFIDGGANMGDTFLLMFDISYKQSKLLMPLNYSRYKTESYLIEANPYFNQTLINLKKHYINNIKRIELQTALYIKNENMKFFLDNINKGGKFYLGSSLISDNEAYTKSKAMQNEKLQKQNENIATNNNNNNEKVLEIAVWGIDICNYILETIKAKIDDYVVLKMDIEGSEYEVLPFIFENKLCLHTIDRLVVEFHDYAKIDKKYDQKQLITMFQKEGVEVILWD